MVYVQTIIFLCEWDDLNSLGFLDTTELSNPAKRPDLEKK